jgi:hypothetical protein
MPRTFALVVVILGLSALAGCAASAPPPALSVASQVPAERVAVQPPSDFDMELASPDAEGSRRFSHDQELAGSLHPKMASHVNE